MEFKIKHNGLNKEHVSCLIVGIFITGKLSYTAQQIDKISNGYISTLLSKGAILGNIGQTLLLYHVPNISSEYILLVGCDDEKYLNIFKYKQIFIEMIDALKSTGIIEVMCFLPELNISGLDVYWKIRQAVENIQESVYVFKRFKTDKNQLYYPLNKIVFNIVNIDELDIVKTAIKHGVAISNSIKIAKDLSNLPPNICNSTYLSLQALELGKLYDKNINVKIIDQLKMKELGMNAYLAVGKGSANESLMSIIEYKGNHDSNCKPIVLIGKGLTFDSGGISIKNANNMDEMKYDMCGAAAVYAIINMAIKLKLPLNIIGILATCENMVDKNSYRPGDILTTLSGQTVEILNTDAEGRLVLCDVLTYVLRYEPSIVIDIATLTGACVVALGHHITGIMSNDTTLSNELVCAGEQANDYAWILPLRDEFQQQLDSNFADMTNVGGKAAGTITAGCFLSRFTKKYKWAHLDIAGTAWISGKTKGATGRPVAMISQFLLNRIQYNHNK